MIIKDYFDSKTKEKIKKQINKIVENQLDCTKNCQGQCQGMGVCKIAVAFRKKHKIILPSIVNNHLK